MTDLKSKIENSSLRKEFDWEKTDIIPTARVPILHLETRGGIQMDVQFEKYASVRNTCYVRHCVEVSKIFVAAKQHYISNHSRGCPTIFISIDYL